MDYNRRRVNISAQRTQSCPVEPSNRSLTRKLDAQKSEQIHRIDSIYDRFLTEIMGIRSCSEDTDHEKYLQAIENLHKSQVMLKEAFVESTYFPD